MAAEWGESGATPSTLEDLYRHARQDVERPRADTALVWAFRHAKAQGRVASAEARMRFLELLTRDVRDRLTAIYPPSPQQMDALAGYGNEASELEGARLDYQEAVAWVAACDHVLRMLGQRPAAQRTGRAA